MKFEINNPTPKHLILAAKLVDLATSQEWCFDYAEIGHNTNSDWVYIWSEWESYSIGICCYNVSDGPQYVWNDPESGDEVIESSLEELKSEVKEQYNEDI